LKTSLTPTHFFILSMVHPATQLINIHYQAI
jgi:hypothetical protein